MKEYFGTDGIRFIYNQEIDILLIKIGKYLSSLKNKTIFIGGDTRSSTPLIINKILSQINNKKIIYLGTISTPGINYLSLKYKAIGISITASHNPPEYNGIKFFYKGYKLNSYQKLRINEYLNYENIDNINNYRHHLKIDDFYKNQYLNYLKTFIHPSKNKILFDVGNGALSYYINEISSLINKDNIVINNSPNETNINLNSGVLYPKLLQEKLISSSLDYAVGFDGDGDRLVLVSKNHIFSGEELTYLYAKYFKKKKIVLSENINPGILSFLNKNKIKYYISDTGDYSLFKKMKKHHCQLGGEESGHIILGKFLPSGDGLLNSILLINILNNLKIENLLTYTPLKNTKINIKLNNKELISHPKILSLISSFKTTFPSLHIKIRKSGTEDLIRINLFYKDNYVIDQISSKLITYLKLLDNKITCHNYDLITISLDSILSDNITLEGVCNISSSTIQSNTYINNSNISSSIIGNNCLIGPYAHIHKNSIIKDNVRIGNYVEIKNSSIDNNTKVAHLSYIGDCIIGHDSNFGAGVIIANYDGKTKHQTVIGNNVFIGCNSSIIAPLKIEDDVFICASSVVNKPLNKCDFFISRSKAIIKPLKAKKYAYYKEKHKCAD